MTYILYLKYTSTETIKEAAVYRTKNEHCFPMKMAKTVFGVTGA